jgi:hypothetical protein
MELPNEQIIAYVADIAGHGLPAGTLMAMLKRRAPNSLIPPGSRSSLSA